MLDMAGNGSAAGIVIEFKGGSDRALSGFPGAIVKGTVKSIEPKGAVIEAYFVQARQGGGTEPADEADTPPAEERTDRMFQRSLRK